MLSQLVSASGNHSAYDTAHASLRRQILRECEEMAEHAFASGLRVPPRVMQVVEAAIQTSRESEGGGEPYDATGAEIARLTTAHEQLAKVVAPATPRALVILADHRQDNSWIGFLGPIPFVRRMMVAAILSLVAFIALPMIPDIDGDAKISNTVSQSGMILLGNMLFLMSAAGLGASFAALFQSSAYINARTWDPQYEVTYWIKLIVGLMAGLMLCLLVPLEFGTEGAPGPEGAMAMYDKPLLALLGGFSAAAVYRILDRLVETVESLVRGSTREAISAAEEQAKIRSQMQAEQLRMRMASNLVSMQQQLAAGGDRAQLQKQLDSMLDTMIPDRADGLAAGAAPVEGAEAGFGTAAVADAFNPASLGAHHGDDESEGEDAEAGTETETEVATAAEGTTVVAAGETEATLPSGVRVPIITFRTPVAASAPADEDDGAVG